MSQDDDLGAFLRSEVPEPGPGYWDEIQARLEQVEAETGVADAGPQGTTGPGLQAIPTPPEISLSSTQTDDNVIRLTDMRHPETLAQPNRKLLPVLAAAAVTLIAVAGGIVALTRNQPGVQIDAASPGESGQATNDAPTTDSTVDPDTTDSDSAAPDLAVEDGSVWITNGTDPVRGLLGPAGEPMEGTVSPYPLIATGQQAEANDRTWVEMMPLRQQPATWYPADLLEKIADPLPNTEPLVVVFIGDSPLEPSNTPGATFDVSETVQPEDALSSTGIRALADDTEWVLIDSEIPFWIDGESVVPIEAFDSRRCFSGAESLLVLDFGPDALTFTARFNYLDSTLLASGIREEVSSSTFAVNTSAIGSAEDTGEPVIVSETWETTEDGMTPGDRDSLPLVSCETVAEEVASLEGFISDEMLLPIPS